MRLWLLCIVAGTWALAAQAAQSGARHETQAAAEPTVTFTLDFPGGQPSHFALEARATGAAWYQSQPQPATPDAVPGDPYLVKFTLSQPTRARIFELAKAANYFQGDFDYKKHRIANTGSKTLSYADGSRRSETSYNWSENRDIQQLTALFHAVANTLESGRRLAYARRYDKLGLDKELRMLEALAERGDAAELGAIAPQLEQIASDASVMRLARERSRRLLDLARTASR